ncbi:MAG TPA: alpha/beta hydrolase [Acidimicrobiia bacterium]|nr:alpha/beta hydrolase [Acidimicrobiia bacterium]
MAELHTDGLRVYYERRGSGPPLLLLNGSGATLATSGMLLDLFTSRFDVAAHDQRGLGRTDVPSGPYSMADYAHDAVALLDALAWERVRVVGISFGGMVAQELAATFPDRVARLALVCTSPGGASASYPLHELADLTPDARAALRPQLLDTRFTPEWLAAHEGDRRLAAMMADRETAPAGSERARGEIEQLRARAGHDVLDRLGAITCPTLVASGRYDGIAPVANGEAIAQRVPNAELRVYEGGHAFFAQDPGALPEILDFLAAAAPPVFAGP